jgi:hypothetical protein
MKTPKAPKPTAQQLAVERRQSMALDKEIEEQEQRQRALARGQLGTRSLLGGVPGMGGKRAGSRASAPTPSRAGTYTGGMGGLGRGLRNINLPG